MTVAPLAPRFDHVMLVAPELDAAIADLEARTGVLAAYGGRHEGLGTHNALLSLGERAYLEILAPEAADSPVLAPGGMLAGLATPRLFMWAVACTDIAATTEYAGCKGYDPGTVIEMSRALPAGGSSKWKLSVGGADVAGSVVPFCIQWLDPAHPAAAAPSGCRLSELRAEHPEPQRIGAALKALQVEMPIAVGDQPALVLTLGTPKGRVVLR